MRGIPAVLVLTAFIGSAASPARAASGLTEFAEAWAKVTDYTVAVKVHEADGSRSEDRMYRFAFKRPHMAKIDIVDGPGKGGGAVWDGGDKVKGHQGGILSGIHLTVDIHDKRATSLRGDTIDTAGFGAMLEQYKSIKGDVSETAGPAIDGTPTDRVMLKIADPAAAHGITRDELYLSRASHFPVRRVRYEGEKIVKDESFSGLKINPGLKDSDFPF